MKTSISRLVLLPGVAKLSVMWGIFYSVRAATGTRLVSVVRSHEGDVRYSGVANVLKHMETHSGHLKVSVIS